MSDNQTMQTGTLHVDARGARLMRQATFAAVAVASILIVVKLVAWVLTDSVAMLSTLIDSLLDAAASLVNLYAVHHALQPADAEHRFGHGKAEPLAGLAQAAFISGSALFLVLEAGERLYRPRDIENTDIGVAVMCVAIVMTLGLVLFQRYVVKKTGSVAIKADSLHYQTDLLVNASVAASLMLVASLGWSWVDPVFALLIAAYILKGAWQIAFQSLHQLMDRELPDDTRAKIKRIAMAHPQVLGIHDMRTRASGAMTFIQIHIELSPQMRLTEAHDVADSVIKMVEAAFPGSEVMIHQDPFGIDERRDEF